MALFNQNQQNQQNQPIAQNQLIALKLKKPIPAFSFMGYARSDHPFENLDRKRGRGLIFIRSTFRTADRAGMHRGMIKLI